MLYAGRSHWPVSSKILLMVLINPAAVAAS